MTITEKDIEEEHPHAPVNTPSLLLAALAIISRTRANWCEGTERAIAERPPSDRASAARERVAGRQPATRRTGPSP